MCERLVFKGVRSVTFGRVFLGSFPVRQRLLGYSYYCRLMVFIRNTASNVIEKSQAVTVTMWERWRHPDVALTSAFIRYDSKGC